MLSTEVVNAAYAAVFRAEPNEAQSLFYSANFDNIDAAVSAMVSAAPNTSTLIEYYQVYFGRLPDAEGLDFWVGQLDNGLTEDQLNAAFFESGEFVSTYEGLTDTQVVTALYQQVLGREPDAPGLTFWVGQLSNGLALSDIAQAFATADETSATFRPLVENYLTALANGDEIAAGSTVFDFPDAGAPIGDDATRFDFGQNTLDGDGSDNVFNAPITQAGDGSGAVTNTFESGDVFNGGGGTDTLNADLTATVTGGVPVGPAISTTSTSVENMFFRTQHDSVEISNNLLGLNGAVNGANGGIGLINSALFASIPSSTIDAQNNDGVQQLWSVDSRADLVIEDVREAPSTVTEGFRDSDPGVSYAVFFDPASLNGDLSNSTLNLFLDDANRADLSEFPVDGVVFTLNGAQQQLRISRDDAATDSYDGFAAALQAAIDADTSGALDGVQAVANAATSTILLTDSNGGIFAPVSYTFVDDQVPFAGNLDFNQTVGQPILGPITTNIVLDGVGRGQEGGVAVFGSMGARDGIEVFNVTVDDDSWTQLLSSTNNILETVNIVNGDTDGDGNANGDLNIGIGTGANDFGVSNTGFNFPLTDDDRVTFALNALGTSTANGFGGITDVQTLNATGFANNLKVAARLTDASINKYLVDATDPVTFQYDLADSASNLTIGIDTNFSNVLAQLHTGATADAANNVINITGDGENDRINLSSPDAGGIDLRAISIDGNRNTPNTGTDINTLELSGILAGAGVGGTAFNSVDDIDNLILAGGADVAVDVTGAGFSGLDTITVKTGGPGTDTPPFANAIIENAEAATAISIDGGNQVLGGANGPLGTPASNANAAQNFGTVTINNNPNVTLNVALDNAANSNGVLTVNDLTIGEANGGTSNVGIVNLLSNGVNGTSNVLGSAAGAGTNGFTGGDVGTLNFVGTQNLTATVEDMANNGSVLVSGTGLSGDLNLTVLGGVLDNDANDQLVGTAGASDVLNLRDAFAPGTETRISGFETLNFLNASGIFDATNVTGLNMVSINGLGGAFSLVDLADGVTVNVNEDGTGAADDLTINGRDSGSVTVNLNAPATGFPNGADTIANGTAQLAIADVDNATINVGNFGGAMLDLVLDDRTGADVVDNTMDTVTIASTGGGIVNFVNAFANTLDTIDLSGIGGATTGVALFDADPSVAAQDNDDVTIVLNGEGGDFTLIDNDAVAGNAVDATNGAVFNDNVIFRFNTVNADAGQEVYMINNFVAFDGTIPANQTPGANNSNRSVLDLTAFGLTSTADLDIDQNGANTDITLDGGSDPWMITLTNTMADGLGDENFIF